VLKKSRAKERRDNIAMTLLTTRTQVRDLAHLKELADGSDGQPPVECILLLNHGAFTRKYIQYVKNGNGRNWWLEEDDNDGSFYTDTRLAAQTNIIQGMQKGALYVEEERETEVLDFTVNDIPPEVQAVLANYPDIIYFSLSHWDELTIYPKDIMQVWYLADGTTLIMLMNREQIQFSEKKQVNFPPECDFYEWVKVPDLISSSS
jgi:hypothetical protein